MSHKPRQPHRRGTLVVGGWRRLSTHTVLRNPWFWVTHEGVIRPDGTRGTYDVVRTHDAVYVVPIDARGRVLLVRQARYPTERYSWELPAGGLAGRTPLAAGKLELREEAGLVAHYWRKLAVLSTINGLSSELMHVFLATGLSQVPTNHQGDEDIRETRWLSIPQAYRWVRQGKIDDAQTIAALSLARVAP